LRDGVRDGVMDRVALLVAVTLRVTLFELVTDRVLLLVVDIDLLGDELGVTATGDRDAVADLVGV